MDAITLKSISDALRKADESGVKNKIEYCYNILPETAQKNLGELLAAMQDADIRRCAYRTRIRTLVEIEKIAGPLLQITDIDDRGCFWIQLRTAAKPAP